MDSFKSNIFGQLKSYGNAVQGAFQERIARPLLELKRDFSRPTSESRISTERHSPSPHEACQGSTPPSLPPENIDTDTSASFRTLFDKVKNTFSPVTRRRTSDNPTKENRTSLVDKKARKTSLSHNKSVSFADNIGSDDDSDNLESYSTDDRNEIVRNAQTLADQILTESIGEAASNKDTRKLSGENNCNNDDGDDFGRDFCRSIKPRRISSDNIEDLVYQDLSAEIVAYVLKHAIRTLKQEQEEILNLSNNTMVNNNNNEQNDDFIDLK